MWPVGRVVFPDFFHPNIVSYWDEMVALGHAVVPFDGLWLVRCAHMTSTTDMFFCIAWYGEQG